MLINTYLDTEDFVHLYYPEDEPPAATAQGCGAGARMASKYQPRPPSPQYTQLALPAPSEMTEREQYRASPQPEQAQQKRAADLYPRLRTHCDETGLSAGFTRICGEYVLFLGRIEDGGVIAISNYRLHIQPGRRNAVGDSVPIRVIDTVEIRDLVHLIVLCKHGRQLRCTFKSGDQCAEWCRRLTTAVTSPMVGVKDTFAAAYAAWAKEEPLTSVHRVLMKASQAPQKHWFGPEAERLGFTRNGAWRVSAANAEYRLCLSYPPLLIVPASVSDEVLDSVARFRAMRRVPAVVWRHRGNGAVIARSSQPEVGWLGWRSTEDERLLSAFVSACNMDTGHNTHSNRNKKLLIVDARSYASAVTNRARGGGSECQQYYPAADIQFMSLPNIHHVRKSFQQLRALVAEPSGDQSNWHSNLERTLWLQYLSGLLRAASSVTRAVLAARPVLVHCSDGWDRTPQIVATAQLMLDPHYRTVDGFRLLVEREWLDFGHKFADRCGHRFGADDPNERSPVFLQWLDIVHQMMLQFPCSFEFNEAYLIKLCMHVHSCMFGTFLCNTSRERHEARMHELTAHVWQLLRAPAYRNHLYATQQFEQVLFPEYNVSALQLWRSMFCSERQDDDHDIIDPPPINDIKTSPKVAMSKTRSCDNLLLEGEANERPAQRRCSDPSLAPDIMKLSNMVSGEESSSRRICRALTDSCVDELPLLHQQEHQVDGLHTDYFENGGCLGHDIASGSSSLERELVGVARGGEGTSNAAETQDVNDAPDVIDATEVTDAIDATDGVVTVGIDTPDEPPVFLCDAFGDVIGLSEARESGRIRNISITWRSISESSNQSSAFETTDTLSLNKPENQQNSDNSHESSPLDNQNSTECEVVNHDADNHDAVNHDLVNHDTINHDTVNHDMVNHNVVSDSEITNHNGESNGDVNVTEEVTAKFLEVDLNGGATSSSASSESEGEAQSAPVRPHSRSRVASLLTLCPGSPRRPCCHCCYCTRRPSTNGGVETPCSSGGGGACGGAAGGGGEVCWCGVCDASVDEGGCARVRCTCGGAGAGGALPPHSALPDPLDGLPPVANPLQTRLHQIILQQNRMLEDLNGRLHDALDRLHRVKSPTAQLEHPASEPVHASACQRDRSSSASASGGSARSESASGSSSASEVEVGEEARSVVWLPDSAAPRCQYCRNHFWLARRRHHCRRCGGIFCGSCAVVSAWGDCSAMRVCRWCREHR